MVVKILFLVVCIAVFFVGLFNIINDNKKKKLCSMNVEATVIELKKEYNSDRLYIYYPVYRYIVNGNEYIIRSKVGASSWPFKQGDTVSIMCNPDDPKMMYLKKDISRLVFGPLVMVAGVVFTIAAVYLCMKV